MLDTGVMPGKIAKNSRYQRSSLNSFPGRPDPAPPLSQLYKLGRNNSDDL
jgi:hypothetical protein